MLWKSETPKKDIRLMEKLGWWSAVVFGVLAVALAGLGYYVNKHGTGYEGAVPDARMEAVVPAGQ